MEIKKVLTRKEGTKIVVVPKNSEIKAGDYVMLTKVREPKEEVTQA